jgi:hypothetical protein
MKRAVVLGSFVAFLLACGPRGEPKQALAPEPLDEPAASESGSGGDDDNGSGLLTPPPVGGGNDGPPPKSGKGEAPNVSSLASFQDGLRWGMSHAEVTKAFTANGGVIWKDYDDKLSKARVGPEMTAIEAEREQAKAAFARSYLEFKDTPTGYDATGIKGEYTYKNKEALMWIQRQGKKRYFFFINDRLWKIYDEVPLGEGGPLGAAYLDAVNKMNGQLGAQGRVRGADPAKGVNTTTVDWKDARSQLRLVDRSGERVVGVILEDSATVGNLASLRTNKVEDPTAIDPSIAAVTGGTNRSDPNADNAPATQPGAKKPASKKKK